MEPPLPHPRLIKVEEGDPHGSLDLLRSSILKVLFMVKGDDGHKPWIKMPPSFGSILYSQYQQLCGLPGPGAGQLGHALYQEGRCQWCGCGLRCANLWDFLHHLREDHQVTSVL